MTAPQVNEGDDLIGVVSELVRQGRLSALSRDSYTDRFGHFTRWCDAHDLTALPCDEQTVLRYLHAHHPAWSHGHAKNTRAAINFVHEDQGHPKPASARTAHYLAVLRSNDKPAQEKVTALRTQEAQAIAGAGRDAPTAEVLLARRVLAVLTALPPSAAPGRPVRGHFGLLRSAVRHVLALTADAFDVSDFDIRVTMPGAVPLLIDASHQPQAHAALMASCSDGQPSVAGAGDDLGVSAERVVTLLRAAWPRAGLPADPTLDAIGLLTVDEQRRLLCHLDDRHADRVRNHAYMATGLFTAMRHVNLSTLDVREVRVLDHGVGVEILVLRSKNDPDGKGLTKVLTHVGESTATCSHPICPACAVIAQLEEVQACQGRSTGPLFATRYGGRWRAMTRQNGRLVLAGAWSAAGLPDGARVATRSLRAGAATSASEAGWELWEIAMDLTDHRDLATCLVYVRQHDPFSHQYQLDL